MSAKLWLTLLAVHLVVLAPANALYALAQGAGGALHFGEFSAVMETVLEGYGLRASDGLDLFALSVNPFTYWRLVALLVFYDYSYFHNDTGRIIQAMLFFGTVGLFLYRASSAGGGLSRFVPWGRR